MEVALGFVTSGEFRQALVTSWYQDHLGRLPESAGMSYWMAQLQQGASQEWVQAQILASSEFLVPKNSLLA